MINDNLLRHLNSNPSTGSRTLTGRPRVARRDETRTNLDDSGKTEGALSATRVPAPVPDDCLLSWSRRRTSPDDAVLWLVTYQICVVFEARVWLVTHQICVVFEARVSRPPTLPDTRLTLGSLPNKGPSFSCRKTTRTFITYPDQLRDPRETIPVIRVHTPETGAVG